jgi:hypothetical protein
MIRIATVAVLIAAAQALTACEANPGATTSTGPSTSSMELMNLGASLLNRPAPVTTNCFHAGLMVSCRSFCGTNAAGLQLTGCSTLQQRPSSSSGTAADSAVAATLPVLRYQLGYWQARNLPGLATSAIPVDVRVTECHEA